MTVVLDTNVLLQSIGRNSKHRPIWDCLVSQKYNLIVSSSILLEYEEIITNKTSARVADIVIKILLESPVVQFVQPSFEWNAIPADSDDNKFFDAAISGNANFIVTTFPTMAVISSDEFVGIVNGLE